MTDGEALWMLDLDRDNWPWRAHEIQAVGNPGPNEVRVTVCGQRVDRFTHPRGWWGVKVGELPLQEHAVHCTVECARTSAEA